MISCIKLKDTPITPNNKLEREYRIYREKMILVLIFSIMKDKD